MATALEKFGKFQPLQSEYKRYMMERERNREKRPPEAGASYPKRAVDETIRERVNKYRDKEFLDKELEEENDTSKKYSDNESEPSEPAPTLANRDLNSEYYGGFDNVPVRKAEAVKPRSEGVQRMQRRMRESLGEEDNTPTITITKKAKEPKEEKPKYIAGFEKAGKPSTIRVGGRKPTFTPEELESRKKMLRRNAVFGRK
jgi:hypothetical protein